MEELFIHQTRKLPEITINSHVFIVDVAFAELREITDPFPISFHDDMRRVRDKYVFDFNGHSLEVDQMVKLDPEGVAMRYGLDRENLPQLDKDLKCDPSLLEKRLVHGVLPIITIMGEEYSVDLKLKELRPKDENLKSIYLNKIEVDASGMGKYYLLYDYDKKQMIPMDEITEVPKNLVEVELPQDYWLDPVEYFKGLKDKFIDRFTLQQNLEARICPVYMPKLRVLIEENKRRRFSERKVVAENVSETKRKKGKRL